MHYKLDNELLKNQFVFFLNKLDTGDSADTPNVLFKDQNADMARKAFQ